MASIPLLTTHCSTPSSSERYTYQIIVRQQPVAARACGFGERDRRFIDPTPIVQLLPILLENDNNNNNNNTTTTITSNNNEIRYPLNVVHCTLWSAEGTTDVTALHRRIDDRLTRRLMGTLVSSPLIANDENNKEGCFFYFPDLACRTCGKYRLRFVLMKLGPNDLEPRSYTPIVATCLSDVFEVYSSKDFPGMRPSTQLTRALNMQGCDILVKKISTNSSSDNNNRINKSTSMKVEFKDEEDGGNTDTDEGLLIEYTIQAKSRTRNK